jgi:putative hydrolase of the HAD superfamily
LKEPSVIESIVSDLGQVLLRFDYEPCWQKILPTCEHPEARAQFRAVLLQTRFGCGQIEPQEFYARAAAAMRTRMSYEEFRVAWSDMFWEDHEVIAMIERAPVRHRLILSNTNAIHWSWIEERYGHVLSRFDRSLVSHECGYEKPAPEVYEIAIRHTGLPPAAHLFIDDLPDNVEGARAAGMDAILHTDAASLREEFRRRGLVPLT